MHHEEAKQLLELCRPGNEADRQDLALAEAFALLESDAKLRAWFDEQQATDARISASINMIEAPAELQTSILAGMRLHLAHNGLNSRRSASYGRQEAELQPKTTDPESWSAPFRASGTHEKAAIPFPPGRQGRQGRQSESPYRTWWRQPWVGIAALFAIAMVVLNLPERDSTQGESTALAGLPPVIQFLSQEIDSLKSRGFDKRDDRAENLKAFLASTQAPSPASLPDCLNKMPTIGCVTFVYGDAKLSMICFKNGEVYHLTTADKSTYPDKLPSEPELFQTTDKAFRLWVEGDQVKILTIHGTKDDMPEFI